MKPILVTYATMAGSTAEVAQAVAEEIEKSGLPVEVRPVDQVNDLEAYAAVVVGGPMIMGWHRAAMGFLKRNRQAWQHVPLAVFVLAISLTETGEREVDGLPIVVDETLPKAPATPGRLSFRERYAQLSRYVGPILAAARPARPVSVGVFGGRLALGGLPWWAMLFVGVIIQAPAGDRRNWAAIRAWAAGLPGKMEEEFTDFADVMQ
ncbi:flavodoxin domain-containing protein [Promineifilum sp.]|uniref:flavodoxin domain-containing protein n=1 Tax=Promineifilum sp. TaxID=2664178 RepID=UPI0035B03108